MRQDIAHIFTHSFIHSQSSSMYLGGERKPENWLLLEVFLASFHIIRNIKIILMCLYDVYVCVCGGEKAENARVSGGEKMVVSDRDRRSYTPGPDQKYRERKRKGGKGTDGNLP